jgi:hypothetical protein
MMNLSKHFTLDEMLKSPTAQRLGIDNTPDAEQLENLRDLVEFILEPLRVHYGRPIIVTSGFRCPKLNKAVGGSSTSQHAKGQAVDIRSVSDRRDDNKEIFDMIREMKLPFDQLIDEFDYDWVHVSYSPRNRRQVLHARKLNGKTVYKPDK